MTHADIPGESRRGRAYPGPRNLAMSIHFWDMDHTLINNDCDVSWKEFLIDKGLAPESARQQIEKFWEQYKNGNLDIDRFMDFQLLEFTGKSGEEIRKLAQEHFTKVVMRTIYDDAVVLIDHHRKNGDFMCLVTATNREIATPVAAELRFDRLLATEPQVLDGRFTGHMAGQYVGGEGKVNCMTSLCDELGVAIADCYYYGDSVADIPVMKAVGHPVVVNPMPALKEAALAHRWKIIRFWN